MCAAAVLLPACSEREQAPPPAPAPTATVTAPATAPTAPAAAPLTEADVAALLRRAVCWRDDPALAASCLPPERVSVEAIEAMRRSGDRRFIAPLIDMRWLAVGWERWVEEALQALTGERFDDPRRWYEWAATARPPLPDGYLAWKAGLLSLIDPAFADFLDDDNAYALRPELLVWGGAAVNEVSPLRDPAIVHRVEERYLRPDDVVFGLVLGGEARAYPRRIVAWHQVVSDQLGGTPVTLVFCPPCGGAVAYDPRTDGERHLLGSAGLVYEARLLLFDEQTKSLWDAFTGRPVGGELLDGGTALGRHALVTTTWGDWAARHPNSSVLDLDTGHVRDYSPGAALRDELGSPEPAFPVAQPDARLPAKTQVLGVVVEGEARAYDVERVRQASIVHDTVGGVPLVLLAEGANAAIRVYRAGALEVTGLSVRDRDLTATGDDGGDGTRWFVQEDALVSTTDGRRYGHVPRQEGYWLAWSGTHPQTTIWGE